MGVCLQTPEGEGDATRDRIGVEGAPSRLPRPQLLFGGVALAAHPSLMVGSSATDRSIDEAAGRNLSATSAPLRLPRSPASGAAYLAAREFCEG
jgi:hypothetical protein